MTLTVQSFDTPIPRDATPDLDIDDDVTDDAPYGYTPTGRVRKRPIGSRNTTGDRKAGASNEKLARQAAQVLAQINEAICLPLTIFGLTMTAGAISARNEAFEEQAYSALLTDPGLCRSVLRAGSKSAGFSLLLAYGMLGMSVSTHAYAEITAIRDARKTRQSTG